MNHHEAAAALKNVSQTQARLAARTQWPLYRHVMFGLSEGLLVAAAAQPSTLMAAMFAVAMSLIVACVAGDRRRDGMFVSGWQRGPTRLLVVLLLAFVLAMAWLAIQVRSGDAVAPLGFGIGLLTFVVCTIASVVWEKIYRAQLLRKDRA